MFEFRSAKTATRQANPAKTTIQLAITPEAKWWILYLAGIENPQDPRKALGATVERAIGMLARAYCRELTQAERDALPDPPRVTRRK